MLQSQVALLESKLKSPGENVEQDAQNPVVELDNSQSGSHTYLLPNDRLKIMLRNIIIYNHHYRGTFVESSEQSVDCSASKFSQSPNIQTLIKHVDRKFTCFKEINLR